MHIHGELMNVQAANFYAASQGERAAAAQRTAETRKKLLKSASQLNGEATPEETLLIGQWLDGRTTQLPNEDQYHPAGYGEDSDFG
jgi:hypothetical protein